MQLVGVLGSGAGEPVFRSPLGHGDDPATLAYDQGFVALQPLEAHRAPDGDLSLSWRVRPLSGDRRPRERPPGRDPDLVLEDGVEPVVRQRLAAYAVVQSRRGLLATEYSRRTAVSGKWGMPGGGIDIGEEPVATVLREVAEETSQFILLEGLRAVQTSHWVGRSPYGVVEDFHAVRLIYLATCDDPSEPVVADAEGTTASARWVPLADWRSLAWTANWRSVLPEVLDT